MPVVRTVTGDVDADDLGPTTMHEHIFGDFTVWLEDPKDTLSLAAVPIDQDANRLQVRVPAAVSGVRLDVGHELLLKDVTGGGVYLL